LRGSQILAVRSDFGETIIAPVDEAAISAIRDELYTPGELLRLGQLAPDRKKVTRNLSQSDLFERSE
jgi:hypothetical protein